MVSRKPVGIGQPVCGGILDLERLELEAPSSKNRRSRDVADVVVTGLCLACLFLW